MKAYEGKRKLRWLRVGGCVIAYIEENKLIDDSLWDAWLAVIESPLTETLMICGWGPIQAGTAQWRRFTNVIKTKEIPTAVVTKDRHNAALAKKAAWIGAKIESFKWDTSLYDPFVFLGFDLETRKLLKPQVFGLRDYHGRSDQRSTSSDKPAREMPAWMREDSGKRPRAVLTGIEQRAAPRRAAKPSASEQAKPSSLAAEFQRSRDAVFRSSSDIQAKLAEVQAKLRARNLEARRRREG